MTSPTTKSESEAAKTATQSQEVKPESRGESFDDVPLHEDLEKYGGGHITSRAGRIDAWLLVVYVVLFLWALYYGYTYWGGLGPGLAD
jgi:hypothetical protein